MESYTKQKKGFTLIELLVVISIIALLLAILMPALGKAKGIAKRVVCQSNLKQQATAFNFYRNDNDDYFPSKPNFVLTYFNWGGTIGSQTGVAGVNRKLLNPYVGAGDEVTLGRVEGGLQIFHCPSDKGMYDGAWATSWGGPDRLPTVWEALGTSYYYNCTAIANNGALGVWNKKVSDTKNPYKLILVGDMTVGTYGFGADPFQYGYWHNKHELGWANTMFVDYHSEYIQVHLDDPDNATYNFQTGQNWTFLFK
ncbi:MAG: type II secretion system protein [Planctomycetes bacterium]|nr:type II secretion system protein [Planctomycetota bacterium]